ncbi:MAG TPA: alpha/beta hydrolase-fold protein, partial [Acidobacteriota bacterium]|nr:alpha/beta hydrolase-fold protein [Acidobacteriota bacterium]
MRKSIYGLFGVLILSSLASQLLARQPFYDRSHYSEVFREERKYRLFLPPAYEDQVVRHYPVIYYFHGHSDRYTLEHYDDGQITVPAVVDFVSKNDVIVVAVDGYVAEHYTGFYGGNPWDIREEGGHYDFGRYFLELIEHIDSTYRTLTDRRHRATSGLSMGGFMSLYLSARFPHLVGSASSFNPGPMFYVGDPGRTVLWWPPHHTDNHTHSRIRLIRASGDYISQYHEEAREIYARALEVDFEYRQDEFNRHAATSIEETFAFHMESFADPTLNNIPVEWSHHNPFAEFDVWGYRFRATGEEKALLYLENVSQGGLRIRTRQWAPDGPPLATRKIEVTTAALYRPNEEYRLIDYDLSRDETRSRMVISDSSGRLSFEVDGSGHQIGIVGRGTGGQPPVLLPVTDKDHLYLPPNETLSLPLRVFNPRGKAMDNVRVQISSEYPTVEIISGSYEITKLGSGEVFDLSPYLSLRLTAGGGYYDFA